MQGKELELLSVFKIYLSQPSSHKMVENIIKQHKLRPDYIRELLYIINTSQIAQNNEDITKLTLQALVQLKVFVRQSWPADGESRQKSEIIASPEDQKELLQQMLQTMYNLCDSYSYGQLLLDTVQLIGRPLCKLFLSDQGFTKCLSNPETVISCFWVLLGISKRYQHSGSYHTFSDFDRLINEIYTYPLVLLKEAAFEAVTVQPVFKYICVKLATKSINHNMSNQLKLQTFEWAKYLIGQLGQISKVKLVQTSWHSMQKGSSQHLTIHKYKWMLKYLTKFVAICLSNRQPIHDKTSQELSIQTDYFIKDNFWDLIDVLCGMMQQAICEKLRYHQLKLLEAMVIHKYRLFLMNPYNTQVIQRMLLPLIILTPDAIKESKQQPARFFQIDENKIIPQNPLESSRQTAIVIWTAIFRKGLEGCREPCLGIIIANALNLLKSWLSPLQYNQVISEDDELKVEVGLKLVSMLLLLPNIKYVQDQIVPFIQLVPRMLKGVKNGIYREWVAVRAVELFTTISHDFQNEDVVYIRNFIFEVVLNYQNNINLNLDLLVIKCCFSFQRLLSLKKSYEELNSEGAKLLFGSFLAIVKIYDLDGMVNVLKRLVRSIGDRLQEDIIIVAREITNSILEYIQKDNEQENKEDLKYMDLINQAADTFVMVLVVVIDNDQLKHTIEVVQTLVLQIAYAVLQQPWQRSQYHLQIIENIICKYYCCCPITKVQDGDLLFKVMLFRVIGLPPQLQQFTTQYPQSTVGKLLAQCEPATEYGLQKYLKILRAFIVQTPIRQPVREISQIRHAITSANNLQLIFLVIETFLTKERTKHLGKILSLLLMVYMLEVNQQNVPTQLHSRVFYHMMQAFSQLRSRPFLTKYVLQLYCLWAHLQSEQAVQKSLLELDDGKRVKFLSILFCNQNYGLKQLEEEEQFKRVLVGMIKIIKVIFRRNDAGLVEFTGVLVNWIIYFQLMILKQNQLIIDDSYFDKSPQLRCDLLNGQYQEDESVNGEQEEEECSNEKQQNRYDLDEHVEDFYMARISLQQTNQAFFSFMTSFQNAYPSIYSKLVSSDEQNNGSMTQILYALGLTHKEQYSSLVHLDRSMICFTD